MALILLSEFILRKSFPIYLDDSMQGNPEIGVSSGEVGRSVFLNPEDLGQILPCSFY